MCPEMSIVVEPYEGPVAQSPRLGASNRFLLEWVALTTRVSPLRRHWVEEVLLIQGKGQNSGRLWAANTAGVRV
jgi:hypothetical protein